MHRSSPSVLLHFGLAALLAVGPSLGQLCTPTLTPGFDNRDGHLPPFEEQPVNPMELSSDGKELWVVNIPDARVAIFDITNSTSDVGPVLVDEVAVGLGPVTIRRRPAQGELVEMWVVCSSSNSIFVINERTRQVTATIRVEHEPADLIFDDGGDLAYVSIAASNQVAEIQATNRTVANRIEFDSILPLAGGQRIHAEEPMSLMLEGSNLYALSNLSGNGTASNVDECSPGVSCFQPTGIPALGQMWNDFNSGLIQEEPPDRDVFRFDVNTPANPGTVVGWRFGTLNFDLQREPGGSNLVVSNVDLRNDQVIFEQVIGFEYLGPFSLHRISRGPDATAASSNTSVAHFDLNDPANVHGTLLAEGYTCAFPNQMAWNSAGDRLYVACYGTSNVAVLDYPPTTVLAELRSGALPNNKAGFGTHGLVLDEARHAVYTFEQGDSSLQVYAANPPTGTVGKPLHPRPIPIGFDITPPNVEAGRFHFNNARNSASGTASCGTCHPFAHLDGEAWDLGDLGGDLQADQPPPPGNRVFGRDLKGLKVTMSLRGIEETPPFHWRGDRDDLQAFGGAQMGLLGGQLLEQRQLEQIDDFIFSLSYRPNPNMGFDRAYTSQAVDGLSCFTNQLSLSFGTDTVNGSIQVSCEDCHGMAGFSGTNNQVNNDLAPAQPPATNFFVAGDATQLRGLFDKASDQVSYSGHVLPATGWGFFNLGATDTVEGFLDNIGNFPGQAERDALKAFFAEFDSGMAPTTAFAWTMDPVTLTNVPPEVTTLFASADAGHNDLIARGWINLGGGPQPMGLLYIPNPAVPLGGVWQTDTTGVGPFSTQLLITATQAGLTVLTFVGTPVGRGYRLALDREMDFLLDGDEAANGASTLTADSDGDAFPDGYEVRLGSLPNSAASVPPAENVAPVISNARVDWDNTTVLKARWDTDGEESISRMRVRDSQNIVIAVEEDLQFKTRHSLVARGLIAGRTYTVEIESEDPANANNPNVPGNRSQVLLASRTMDPRLFLNTMHVETTQLTVQGPIAFGAPVPLQATFEIHDGATSAPLANHPVSLTFNFFEWIPGGTGAITAVPMTVNGTTDGAGVLTTNFSTTNVVAGQGGVAEVVVTGLTESVGFRMFFRVESGQKGFNDQIPLP